jgi:cell wall-associated NlpC family hydrolase
VLRLVRRTRLTLSAAILAASTAPFLGASVARADPQSDVRDAQARLNAVADQAEQVTERWHASRLALTRAQGAQKAAEAALTRARSEVDGARSRVAASAASEYKAGALGQVAVFVGSSDPRSFLERAASLGQVAHIRGQDIARLGAIVKRQSDAQTLVDQTTREARGAAAAADTEKSAVDRALASQRSILDDALAKQAQVVAAAAAAAAAADAANRAAAEAAVQRARDLQAQLQSQREATPTTVAEPVDNAPVPRSGDGVGAVIAAAKAQLGKPYVYGSAGPGTFDCSGLTMWAYRAAGVSLAHYTGSQFQSGRHISRGELQPGDLVFFYSDVHHVGIYLGGGQMIDAPHSGAVVRIEPLFDNYAGAVRILG